MESVDSGFQQPEHLVRYGPTLFVQIGFDLIHELIGDAARIRPELPNELWPALVDTGAADNAIDSALAESLALPVVDRCDLSSALGPGPVNIHLAQIHIPGLQETITGRFAGVHLAAGGQPHRALIGRTFLQRFTMTYEGRSGTVTIAR